MSTTCYSLVLALALLYICLFTLTISHRSLIYVRLIIAPLAILNFWNFGYGSYRPPTRMMSCTMASIGCYGIMRALEHSIVSFWDPVPPHWVTRARENGPRIAHPPLMSFRGRCFYAFDLLTSYRGASWSPDREWNWIPLRLQSWTPVSSRQFVMRGVKTILINYLLLDLLDKVTKSRSWDTTSPYPVSSLPVLEQSFFTICICWGTFLSINYGYSVTSTVCVLFGSSPDSWPPMFDSPFSSTSLSDFWGHRWHWMFRRVFDRLSLPLVCMTTSIVYLTGKDVHQQEHIISAIRTIIIFWLSTLLHLFIVYRVAQQEYGKNYGIDNPPFWNPDILMFFMSQPFGLLFESTIIIPVADWMFPPQEHRRGSQKTSTSRHPSSRYRWQRLAFTRLYAWMFLTWTGRWLADNHVGAGFFHEDEVAVPFSLWRSRKW